MSVKTENTEKKTAENRRRREQSGTMLVLHILIVVLLIAVIVLAGMLYLAKAGLLFRPSGPDAPAQAGPLKIAATPEPVVYTAAFITPLDEAITISAAEGEAIRLPDAPVMEGQTFIGWVDSQGNPLEQDEIVLNADASFSAVYAVAFRDASKASSHQPYFSFDEDGMFRPEEILTRSEAVRILYSLLDTDLVGSSSFSDLEKDDDCYAAAAALKDLGMISGSRFHPDDPISCGDLFECLSSVFPRCTAEYSFDHIPQSDPRYNAFCLAMEQGWIEDSSLSPDHDLTRREAARIFNRLSGRTPVAETDYSKAGTILDVSFSDPDFWEIAEAVIPHTASFGESGELWTSSEALPLLEEGLFFTGTKLRCIDERGSAVVNASYGNFDFGADGVITTGMPELDKLVQEKLVELALDPESMEPEQMLRKIYDDVTYHNSYLGARKDELHEVGDISWVNDAAYRMFTTKKGCCYNFAAEFYVLSRAIGFDSVIYSGRINPPPNQRPHGWVEIEFDGVPFIFVTLLEFTQVISGFTGTVYYKISYERVKGWYYDRGE